MQPPPPCIEQAMYTALIQPLLPGIEQAMYIAHRSTARNKPAMPGRQQTIRAPPEHCPTRSEIAIRRRSSSRLLHELEPLLPPISTASRLHLDCISTVSRLHLDCISTASRPSLAPVAPARASPAAPAPAPPASRRAAAPSPPAAAPGAARGRRGGAASQPATEHVSSRYGGTKIPHLETSRETCHSRATSSSLRDNCADLRAGGRYRAACSEHRVETEGYEYSGTPLNTAEYSRRRVFGSAGRDTGARLPLLGRDGETCGDMRRYGEVFRF